MANSLAIIIAEAEEIEKLAETAENEEIFYSQKRMTESFSQKTRSRNNRHVEDVVDSDSDEEIK